jgi:hypothetical protein
MFYKTLSSRSISDSAYLTSHSPTKYVPLLTPELNTVNILNSSIVNRNYVCTVEITTCFRIIGEHLKFCFKSFRGHPKNSRDVKFPGGTPLTTSAVLCVNLNVNHRQHKSQFVIPHSVRLMLITRTFFIYTSIHVNQYVDLYCSGQYMEERQIRSNWFSVKRHGISSAKFMCGIRLVLRKIAIFKINI